MGYRVVYLLRSLIPTVAVRLAMDDGEVAFRARWKRPALELHRRILFCLREGRRLWFEDYAGHTRCFEPERVRGVLVDGQFSAVPPAGPVAARRQHPARDATSDPAPGEGSVPSSPEIPPHEG
ncbi:MAG: hypothetical protein HY704_01285 [Gemmatimonadetes bacterium]|nr:hypothetical protein [Gemmatimonadota bacterium]